MPGAAPTPRTAEPREPDGTEGVTQAAAETPVASEAGQESAALPQEPPEGFLPRLELFFPEGELNLRVSRLVNKVFFEGQVNYNVVEGDITAFLRYRYYGYRRTLQFTLFDAVEFDQIARLSDDFSRVRGALSLFQWPHSFHRRSSMLIEVDRILSSKEEFQFANRKTNSFIRLAHQLGTPRDSRSNALLGEPRAQIERLFTPFRAIGPDGAGFTAAATYSFGLGVGDFRYLKLEFEGLKRLRLSDRNFLVARIHGGSFPVKDRCEPGDPETACEGRTEEEISQEDRFSIPRFDLLRLDGRDNLKGLGGRARGTEELHATFELFFPWFLDADYRVLGLRWTNWYWVVYGGVGTVGFNRDVYRQLDDYIPDIGVGFESSLRIKKYTFFLSAILAQAFDGEGGLETRLSVKSYH